MKFRLQINVEGKPVMQATATAVMTHDTICRFVETYMPEMRGLIVMVPDQLGRLLDCAIGETFSDRWIAVGGKRVEYEAIKIEDESEW
jgi:hypothetical protein